MDSGADSSLKFYYLAEMQELNFLVQEHYEICHCLYYLLPG
jgi:hypothetical protein